MTVVSFATSAPELLVSLQAALDGSPDIALGQHRPGFGVNSYNYTTYCYQGFLSDQLANDDDTVYSTLFFPEARQRFKSP